MLTSSCFPPQTNCMMCEKEGVEVEKGGDEEKMNEKQSG